MIEAIIQYWQLSAAFVVISIITVFVWMKASKAARRTKSEREKIISRLKYENKTRAEYAQLTAELIKTSQAQKLFDGVALNIQANIEKASDMNAAFDQLNLPQKYIYSLYYFVQDSKEKLSRFFKMNGKPLTDVAAEAIKLIFGCKVYELYTEEYRAFDEDNEDVSLLKDEIEKTNAAFALVMEQTDIYALAAAYIKQNSDQFIGEYRIDL